MVGQAWHSQSPGHFKLQVDGSARAAAAAPYSRAYTNSAGEPVAEQHADSAAQPVAEPNQHVAEPAPEPVTEPHPKPAPHAHAAQAHPSAVAGVVPP
jgi:hypothetical protein